MVCNQTLAIAEKSLQLESIYFRLDRQQEKAID